jgi:hypothetical protein
VVPFGTSQSEVTVESIEIMTIEKKWKYRKWNREIRRDKMFNGINVETAKNYKDFHGRKFIRVPSTAQANM